MLEMQSLLSKSRDSVLSLFVCASFVFLALTLVSAALVPPDAEETNVEQTSVTPLSAGEVKDIIRTTSETYTPYLYLPDHLGIEPIVVKKVYSGRDLKIVRNNEVPVTVSGAILVQRNRESMEVLSIHSIRVKRALSNYFIVVVEEEAKSGYYTLEFIESGEQKALSLEIEGLPDKRPERKGIVTKPLDPRINALTRIDCSYCFWEMVFKVNPLDERFGYIVATSKLMQTKDAWQSSITEEVSRLSDPREGYYLGDPKLAFTQDGKLIVSGLVQLERKPISGSVHIEKEPLSYPSSLAQITLYDTSSYNLSLNNVVVDYTKIAVDTFANSPYFNSIYVTSNNLGNSPDLFILRNGTIHEKYFDNSSYFFQPPVSLMVGKEGVVYGARREFEKMIFYRSQNGGESFEEKTIDFMDRRCQGGARVSEKDKRWWALYSGPELVEDESGRLFALYAFPEKCKKDTESEVVNEINYNYDVFLTYSDDRGETWGIPVRVSEDPAADEGFPSLALDNEGRVYAVYLRQYINGNDAGKYDVFLSRSDNRGESFSKGIRVNDITVPNHVGGRAIGDYLDMLDVGTNTIFVAYPCTGQTLSGYENGPSRTCVATLNKSITFEPQETIVKRPRLPPPLSILTNLNKNKSLIGLVSGRIEMLRKEVWTDTGLFNYTENVYLSPESNFNLRATFNHEEIRLHEPGKYRLIYNFTAYEGRDSTTTDAVAYFTVK